MSSMFPEEFSETLLSWQCSWEIPEQQHFYDDIQYCSFLPCYVFDNVSVDSVSRTLFNY